MPVRSRVGVLISYSFSERGLSSRFAARRVLVVGRHPLDVFFVDADQRRRMHGYADAQVFDGPDDGAELEVDARAVEVQRADIVHSVERKRVVVVCFRIVVVVAVENVLNADGESQIEDVLDVEASRYAVLVDASLVDVAHRRIGPRAGGQIVRYGILLIVLRVAHRVEYPRLVCQNAAPQGRRPRVGKAGRDRCRGGPATRGGRRSCIRPARP